MKRKFEKYDTRFECQPDCANCCRFEGGFVYLSDREAEAIGEFLNLSKDDFLNFYTRSIDDEICLIESDSDSCIFLEDNCCTIYAVRPRQCRAYPFWPQNMKSLKQWRSMAGECPGIGRGRVYSVTEIDAMLKSKEV